MAKTSGIKFRKTSAMFNDVVASMKICESSGSEHYSPDDLENDLSDLVNSFIENETECVDNLSDNDTNNDSEGDLDESQSNCLLDSVKNINKLKSLVNKREDDDMVKKIRAATEIACGIIAESSVRSSSYKRKIMSHLREMGYDAGLCKARREKFGKDLAGEYEFVDVIIGEKRLIVEVNISGEFEIARPTSNYTELLDVFPKIFIGRPNDVNQIVRIMSNAIKDSKKEVSLHVPPWRKNGYMQAKWSSPYKRTINPQASIGKRPESDENFVVKMSFASRCRDAAAGRLGMKVSYLTAAFNASDL